MSFESAPMPLPSDFPTVLPLPLAGERLLSRTATFGEAFCGDGSLRLTGLSAAAANLVGDSLPFDLDGGSGAVSFCCCAISSSVPLLCCCCTGEVVKSIPTPGAATLESAMQTTEAGRRCWARKTPRLCCQICLLQSTLLSLHGRECFRVC